MFTILRPRMSHCWYAHGPVASVSFLDSQPLAQGSKEAYALCLKSGRVSSFPSFPQPLKFVSGYLTICTTWPLVWMRISWHLRVLRPEEGGTVCVGSRAGTGTHCSASFSSVPSNPLLDFRDWCCYFGYFTDVIISDPPNSLWPE